MLQVKKFELVWKNGVI